MARYVWSCNCGEVLTVKHANADTARTRALDELKQHRDQHAARGEQCAVSGPMPPRFLPWPDVDVVPSE